MTPRPPELSATQRMEYLANANDVRHRRAMLRREIETGQRDPVATLADPPDVLMTVKLGQFLLWIPKVGKVRRSELLTQLDVSPKTSLYGLGPDKRRRVAVALGRLRVVRNQRVRAMIDRGDHKLSA